MASKLRRTPLFGYDGNLGIPILPSTNGKANQTYGYQVSYLLMIFAIYMAGNYRDHFI